MAARQVVGGFSDSHRSSLLHIQKKMEMELQCPACLDLLNLPTLLPCDHICCKKCVLYLMEDGHCSACRLPFIGRKEELRVISSIQNMVEQFNFMSAIFAAIPLQILDVPTSQNTEKKRQKLHFEPDEKVGSSTLQLVVKNEDDHILTLESTLETTGEKLELQPIDVGVAGAQHGDPDAEGVQHVEVIVEGIQHADAGFEGTRHIDVEGAQHKNVVVEGESAQHVNVVEGDGAQHVNVGVEGERAQHVNVGVEDERAQHVNVGVEGKGAQHVNVGVEGKGAQHVNVGVEGERAQHVNVGVEGKGAQHVNVGVEGKGAQHVNVGVEGERDQHVNVGVEGKGAQQVSIGVEGAQHINVGVEGKQLINVEDILVVCQSNLSKQGKKRQRLQSDLDYQVGESKLCSNGKDDNEDHHLLNDVHKYCPNSEPRHHGYRQIHFSNTRDEIAGNCVFCKSPHVTEFSGPMQYFSKGKTKVSKTSSKNSNVLHIHENCFSWSPKIFYNGDIVQNLEAEVSRASKLKCTHCGKKGAALGCYKDRCRKSYHVPCARELQERCRWDVPGYHLFCPDHISEKFPSDRSTTEKTVIDLKKVRDKPDILLKELTGIKHVECSGDVWKLAHNITKEWVLCGSSLSATEKILLENFAKLTGSVVLEHWKENVTHVVAATNDLGGCSRTVKFIKAILTGKWILTIKWIKESLKAKHPIAEDPYEITHDIHGVFDGPKTGRIQVMEKALPLFSGLSFCFSSFSQFPPSYKRHLESMIMLGGGKIINERDLCDGGWFEPINDTQFHTTFVVYNLDNTDRCDPMAYSHLIRDRIEATKATANKLSAKVISHRWILDSLAACKIQSEVVI